MGGFVWEADIRYRYGIIFVFFLCTVDCWETKSMCIQCINHTRDSKMSDIAMVNGRCTSLDKCVTRSMLQRYQDGSVFSKVERDLIF